MVDSPLKHMDAQEIEVRKRILDWAGPAFPLEIRDEAARVYIDYIRSRMAEELDYYTTELKFGTGGLRGVIGNGPGRMNQWTVGRATMGLCRYLLGCFESPSLVVAYDSRRMSLEFARTTAGVAASMGLTVYLFDSVTPTPILSYAIRELKASGGVVITASHNPPEYNGYKVYLDDGSQLVGPPQEGVESSIESVTDWGSIPFLDPEDPLFKQRVRMVGDEIKRSYIDAFRSLLFVSEPGEKKKNLRIVYSPLHGTGGLWLPGLLEEYGFQVAMVEDQAKPDGEFPTVKYPNPEEPEALKMAEEMARKTEAHLFLATDPDADRLDAGFRNASGDYVLLNGNQIGSMMCAFLAEKMAKMHRSGTAAARGREPRWNIIKTIVTTDLQKVIAEENGIRIRDVLTGFKYVAEQMHFMEEGSSGYDTERDRFLFGGEESFGYLPVDFVRDKDSLSAALLLCEIVAEVGDPLAYLEEIYLKYGLYLELLKSVTLKGSSGQKKMEQIIEKLRTDDLVGWELGSRKVVSVLDYQSQTKNGKASPKDFASLPKSNVLQLMLEPEGKLTIRPSGTEPKIKLYASLRYAGTIADREALQLARSEMEDELASVAGYFFARTGISG